LTSLIIFGQVTSPSTTVASQISVTTATTQVGVAATLTGIIGSAKGLATAGAVGVLAVGTAIYSGPEGQTPPQTQAIQTKLVTIASPSSAKADSPSENWYYLPQGSDGPLMMRAVSNAATSKSSLSLWLQNAEANYTFDSSQKTVALNNHKMWQPDLSVFRLPTDTLELSDFISLVESRESPIELVAPTGKNFLVISSFDEASQGFLSQVTKNENLLDEQFFQFNWPNGVTVVDRRDVMHKRGWTYFRITGELAGRRVTGQGRIPFVYENYLTESPWLRLQIDDSVEIIDSRSGSWVLDAQGDTISQAKPQSYFTGLSRPWMGLHTIDSIRRDAAEKYLMFETRVSEDRSFAEVVVSADMESKSFQLVFAIDMQRDVLTSISIAQQAGESWESAGELHFDYLQNLSSDTGEFIEPRARRYGSKEEPQGLLWILNLATDATE